MINYYYKSVFNKKIRKYSKYIKGCYINCFNLTDIEIELLVKKYKLSKDLINDALDLYEVPRYEVENGYFYLFTRIPNINNDKDIDTIPVLLVKSEDFIVSICINDVIGINKFLLSNPTTTQRTKFILNFLLFTNNLYKKELHTISKNIMNIGKKIEGLDNKQIIKLIQNEKKINDFINALSPTKLIFQKILHENALNYVENDRDLVEDLKLSSNQLNEICISTLKYSVSIREAYSAIITNNLNKVMKVLTALTLIFTIPTFIASFFGMNVWLPFSDNSNAYIIITLLITALTTAIVYIFYKLKLL